ncbi:hypothetical protein C7449_104109 [Mycoplana dimorpha]|uniref:Uncharacterized protein n=1 Tax=Mycoplana dimorpha TaxID=28320 RepID=A0A2T5B7S8_MYCDI|nr:hypothetical protein C7449_104109 [Mycoplana dimorpha]
MVLALLCLVMFFLLTAASMRAVREEVARPVAAAPKRRGFMASGAQE